MGMLITIDILLKAVSKQGTVVNKMSLKCQWGLSIITLTIGKVLND